MWKCPECETLNQGETCAVCGTKKPQVVQQQSNAFIENDQTKIKKSENNKSMVVLVSVLAVVIIAMAAVIVALAFGNDKEEETPTPTPVATENVQPTPTVAVTDAPMPTPVITPQPASTTGSASDIKWIQDQYYATQNILEDCQVVGNGAGVNFYYYNGEILRVDVPAGYGHEYARNYYFDNGKMYFTLAYLSKTDQHRLYFKDGWLIRWKDSDGDIHDNQYSNQGYRDWNYSIQQDVAQYELY